MTYEEALQYIHGISPTFCKPGLERIRALCEALGNPQASLRFIHVAGTNGKGSFSSMISSILRASGLKVGLYTSPHMMRFNERMRINGKDIPDSTLARLTETVRPIADAMTDGPTEFELITAIALCYFKEENVDVAVLECGMGGRLDSTNVINAPLLSVITGISLDHTAFLGDTAERIALEKAGIIKRGVPVLYGGEDESAAEVIKAEAERLCSRFVRADYSRLNIRRSDLESTVFDYRDRTELEISLLGSYQPRNASLVLDAVDLLRRDFPEITEASIKKGLADARWPARFEIISRDPTVIFDGAHNPQGIECAVRSISEYFGTEGVIAVSGVLRDKDYVKIAREISAVAHCAFTLTPDSPRALSAEEYRDTLRAFGTHAEAKESVKDALTCAVKLARTLGKKIVCLGSLYTYSDVVAALNEIKSPK